MGLTRTGPRRLVGALIALGLTATSCSTGPPARPEPSAPSTTAPPTAKEVLLDKIARATDREGVDLTLSTLPANPPEGFSRSAMAALAMEVAALVERGSSPRLTTMSKREAFRHVFSGPSRDTRELARGAGAGAELGDHDWEILYVDRFDRARPDPTYLVARWDVRTTTADFDDGTSVPVLEVELQTVTRYDDDSSRPLVVMRSYALTDHQEEGGRSSQSITTAYSPLFSDWCGFTNGAILRPAATNANLRRDLRLYRAVMARADDDRSITAVVSADNTKAMARCETRS